MFDFRVQRRSAPNGEYVGAHCESDDIEYIVYFACRTFRIIIDASHIDFTDEENGVLSNPHDDYYQEYRFY